MKQDFPIGSITVLEQDIANATIDEAKEECKFDPLNLLVTSRKCFNLALDWTEAYLRKIRFSFTKRLKNVKFYIERPEEEMIGGKVLNLAFLVQNSLEVTALTIPLNS